MQPGTGVGVGDMSLFLDTEVRDQDLVASVAASAWLEGRLSMGGVKRDKAKKDLILKGLTETQRCLLLFGTAHTNPNDQFRDI